MVSGFWLPNDFEFVLSPPNPIPWSFMLLSFRVVVPAGTMGVGVGVGVLLTIGAVVGVIGVIDAVGFGVGVGKL